MARYDNLFGDPNPLMLQKDQQMLLYEWQSETFEECVDMYKPREEADFSDLDPQWNSTDESIQRHLYNNPQLFDLLTDEQKQNETFVNAYRAGIFSQSNHSNNGQWLSGDRVVGTYWYNPECTKFYSIEGYQMAMENLLRSPCNHTVMDYSGKAPRSSEKVPAELVYISTMREQHPELARELDKAERRAFERVYPELAETIYHGLHEDGRVNPYWADVLDERVGEFLEQKMNPTTITTDSQIFNNCNVFLLTEDQRRVLAQGQSNQSYQRAEVVASLASPTNREPYKTAADVVAALREIETKTPLGERAEATALVWGNLSNELRNNADEMLTLIDMYPGAIFEADKSLLTSEYLEQAIMKNPHVYDVLPQFLQASDPVINIYRESLLSQNDWPQHTLNNYGPGYYVQPFAPNPDCPPEKLYSVEGYRDAFSKLLTYHNMSIYEGGHMPDYKRELGAALTYIANAREMFPELAREFDNAEREAFNSVREALVERYAIPGSDLRDICAFLDQRGLDSQEFKNDVHFLMCQNIGAEVYRCSFEENYSIETVEAVFALMQEVPYSEISEHFSLEDFWGQCGRVSVDDPLLAETLERLTAGNTQTAEFIEQYVEEGKGFGLAQSEFTQTDD